MKIKNKIIALVEIAIVLCSLFLVTIPAIAAEQTTQEVSASEVTTASADDYVLEVYGNANEDDTIDMRDLTYVKLIFFGKKPDTELADAKYDGKINPLDFIQIKLIIVGKEKELTLIDTADRIVTVKKPIKSVITLTDDSAEVIQSLGAEDTIIGVEMDIKEKELFFPELSKLPCVQVGWTPDIEAILNLKPEIVIDYLSASLKVEDKLRGTGITVIAFDCYKPKTMLEELEKLGYMFNKKNEAREFIDFHTGYVNTINERVEKLSEDEKPRVYLDYGGRYYAVTGWGGTHQICVMAGGVNIAADLKGGKDVDPEWVIEQNPDIIIIWTADSYASCGYDEDDPTEMTELRKEFMSKPELQNVSAVKNERCYMIADEITSGPGFLVGIVYMAKWFHPELFEDLDPKAIHQEYLTRFQGLDYDLDKQGVFVYPEPS